MEHDIYVGVLYSELVERKKEKSIEPGLGRRKRGLDLSCSLNCPLR